MSHPQEFYWFSQSSDQRTPWPLDEFELHQQVSGLNSLPTVRILFAGQKLCVLPLLSYPLAYSDAESVCTVQYCIGRLPKQRERADYFCTMIWQYDNDTVLYSPRALRWRYTVEIRTLPDSLINLYPNSKKRGPYNLVRKVGFEASCKSLGNISHILSWIDRAESARIGLLSRPIKGSLSCIIQYYDTVVVVVEIRDLQTLHSRNLCIRRLW